MMQRYKKYLKPPNISASFFAEKYTKGTVPFVYSSFMSTFLFSSFLHYLQFGNKFFVVTTLGTLNSLLVNEPFQRFLS